MNNNEQGKSHDNITKLTHWCQFGWFYRRAEEEARKLSESLKESRDSKLFRKRKRTDSMSNLMPGTSRQALLPNPPKQPNLQMHPPTDLLQALTGLVNTFSKNGPEQQRQQHQLQYQPQLQQSSRGKGPANGRGFPRKGAPPSGQ